MEFHHVNLRPRMDCTDGKWSNEAKVANRPGMLTRQSGKLNRPKTRAEKQQSGNGCTSTEKKDDTGVLVEEIVDKECLAEEVDLSVKEVKGARSAKNSEVSRKKDQKKQSRDQEIHAVDSIKGSTEGNNIAKRKRGRPKKLSQKQTGERSTGPDMKDSCVGDEARSSGKNDCVMSTTVDEISKNGNFQPSGPSKEGKVYKMRSKSGVRRLSKTATTPLHEDQAGETILSERVNRPKNSVSDGHGELRKTVDSESRYQDCHEIDHEKYYDMMIDDANVDQPLSMCLNILPPIGSDDSRALPVGRQDGSGTPPLNQEKESSPLEITDGPGDLAVKNLNQCAASNDNGGGLGIPAIVSIDSMQTEESLPFVKRCRMWKFIDSEEIYNKMMPKPHFSPLYRHIEETREELAISQIAKFFNLVDDTAKLQLSSDISVIQSGLKSLAELKSHGFDVEKVQASLMQLLLKKQRADELQKEYEDIGSKISNSFDDGELDEEISQLCQKLREIEKKLGEAKSKKENREKALLALQSKRDTVAENVKSLQVEYESIVGSLRKQSSIS